jgi:outer membrane usher protein
MPANWSRAALPLALFLAGWLAAEANSAAISQASPTQDPSTTIAAKNTEITLPLKDGGLSLGDILVQMTTDNAVSPQRAGFLTALGKILRPDVLSALEKNLPNTYYITLAQIEAAGLSCKYGAESLEITVAPKVEQRPRGEITGSMRSQGVPDEDLAKRAMVSGFVNMHFGANYVRNGSNDDNGLIEFPAAVLEGAFRLWDFVLEAEVDAAVDGSIIRRGTRAIYDLPDSAIRITAGDITSSVGSANVLPALMGMRVEKSFQKLQPTRNIRPTGRRSFRVERPSDVEVLLNNRPVRRLKLGPGEYDLDSLPLTAGNNDIRLIIKDDTGREESLDFSILFDRALLTPGLTEWEVTAGFAADTKTLTYNYAQPYAAAAYRLGMLENLTSRISVTADKDSGLLGLGALWQTPLGLVAVEGAASTGAEGMGLSGTADVEVPLDPETNQALLLGLELESGGFARPGAGFPGRHSRLRARGGLSSPLGENISATFSGHYALAGEDREDAFGVGVSLSRAMGDGVTLSLSGGYSSEASDETHSVLSTGLSIYGRLNYRMGSSSNMSLGYDAADQRLTTSAATAAGNGAGGWSTRLEVMREPGRKSAATSTSVEGSFTYIGNRFELDTAHGGDFTRLSNAHGVHHSATIGTAIAFADSSFAVGRPVRSSFAVVGMHPSLKESTLRLSPSDEGEVATSDWLGPALVSDISPYAPAHLSYDVADLPDGYDIGTGAFDMQAPYKTGYGLTVGSGFAVTAIGALSDTEGKRLKLLSAEAFEKRNPERKVALFTNEEGRFGGQGFGPGEWIIEIAGPSAHRFAFTLPENAAGVVDLGTMTPASAGQ